MSVAASKCRMYQNTDSDLEYFQMLMHALTFFVVCVPVMSPVTGSKEQRCPAPRLLLLVSLCYHLQSGSFVLQVSFYRLHLNLGKQLFWLPTWC